MLTLLLTIFGLNKTSLHSAVPSSLKLVALRIVDSSETCVHFLVNTEPPYEALDDAGGKPGRRTNVACRYAVHKTKSERFEVHMFFNPISLLFSIRLLVRNIRPIKQHNLLGSEPPNNLLVQNHAFQARDHFPVNTIIATHAYTTSIHRPSSHPVFPFSSLFLTWSTQTCSSYA